MNQLIPANEQDRLAALRSYEVLDTPAEAVFDRITTLAARIFDVPIATMSLIDERRQWFKSCVGVENSETPRELAFCAHAILSDEVLVIPDATADPRFADHPLVTGEPYIRFYAGAPLRTAGGLNLGTLCVVDTKPREFTHADRLTLTDLAALMMDELRLRQAAADIRRNEAQFRALTDNAQDIITVLSAEGRIEFESPSVERVLGYNPVELLGRNAFEFVHPDDTAATAERFQQAIEGASVSTEFRFRHKDGSYRWLEAVGSNRSDDPTVAGIVINSRDITHRRDAEERLRLLESVAVNARDAILITEAEPVELPGPRIKYVNEAFTKMSGYAAEEIIGKTPRILQGPKTDRLQLNKIRAALKAWKPVVVELVNYHKDGTEFWVELSIVPVADASGWYTHWVSVQRDISRRKEVEAALRAAKEEAEQANRAKSEFLSRMSHELRTPLNAILGFAQLLDIDPANPDDRESVEQITKAGRHLLDLINEVLDIARIEAGRLELSIEPVDLDEALQEAFDIVRPLATARHISMHALDCGSFVLADRQRIKQVFLNLLSNAIKYNRAGGTVRVSCERVASESGGATARISVTDTGAGIAPDGLDKLFVPFQRLEPETSEVEGIGLGLAICKRLVELMGGAIGASSVTGEGSTFWLELPLTANPVEQLEMLSSGATSGNAERQPEATVLYIEDNLSNLRLVERILARRPEFKLLAAMQSELGLLLAQQHRPDLILLDLHLPHMDGREVLAQLRADERTSAIPVIIISADATPSEITRMKEAGAAAFLTKPLELPLFLQTLDEALGRPTAPTPPR